MAWQGGAEKGRLLTLTFDSSSNSVIERQNTTYIERSTKPKTLDLYLGAREEQPLMPLTWIVF